MKKHAALFVQCLVDCMYPEVAEAMAEVLQKFGVSITCPSDQTCCGQPAFNAGHRREARIAAKRFVGIFEHAEAVVCPSGSCVNTVRNHYPRLFQNDGEWLRRCVNIGRKTFEFAEYLVDILGVEDTGAVYEGKITYHDSCHLNRGLGISAQPRKLLSHVLGAEFVEMKDSDRCCGFGGAFSVKYPEISSAILREKVENIIDSGADLVVGCDIGCLMNIDGMLRRMGSHVKTAHIAQVVAGKGGGHG